MYITSFFSLSELYELKDKKIFITGGTGFIGKWLILSLLYINKNFNLNLSITVLTRNQKKFHFEYPDIANDKAVSFNNGDIRSFEFCNTCYDFFVHAATDVENKISDSEMLSTTIDGTKRVIDFAKKTNVKDILYTSSGAVYGHHKTKTGSVENFINNNKVSSYGKGKKISEELLLEASLKFNFKLSIARIYAQVGPLMPFNKHFAIGNFINDALHNRPIVINGDGSPKRAYLYISDTIVRLIKLMISSKKTDIWNISGDEAVSIKNLAQLISKLLDSDKGIIINSATKPINDIDYYYGSPLKINKEFDLIKTFTLNESIIKTADWLKVNYNLNDDIFKYEM